MKREVALGFIPGISVEICPILNRAAESLYTKESYIFAQNCVKGEVCVVCPEVTMPRVILMGEHDTPG